MNKKFDNIISLGSFCSVAMELEKRGLRCASYPFDWLITDRLEAVIDLIGNNFNDFLSCPQMCREGRPDVYFNRKTSSHFYHDFNPHDPLEEQIPQLQKKYDRRISRFYSDIRKPTLFIRYCIRPYDEEYVRNNRESIAVFLKSFNPENRILYIMSSGDSNRMIPDESGDGTVCLIRQPENDFVRDWIGAVPGLGRYLYSVSRLSRREILRNIFICYRKKVMKKLHLR